MDQVKLRAIAEWEAPTTTKGLRSLLGFTNFYRGFIEGYSKICAPLNSLTGKGTPFKWGLEHQNAFEMFKEKFIAEPNLGQWDPDKETRLEADCSRYALGGCLLQKQDDSSWKPVAYHSRKLTGPEMNYEIHDKELPSIVACTKIWDAELRGLAEPFTILGDHMNLKYFLSTKRLTERQIRRAEFMSRFRYNLLYIKGAENERSDDLSHREQDKSTEGDPRLLGRERQVLKPINMVKLVIVNIEGKEIFVNEDLQNLWVEALKKDPHFIKIVETVKRGDPTWLVDLKITKGSSEPKPL